MKTTRTHALKAALVERYLSVVSMAEICRTSFVCYLESAKTKVWETAEFKRLPSWAQNYVQGYCDARYKEMTRQLAYVHVWQGRIYLSLDAMPADALAYLRAENSGNFDRLVSNHVWPVVRESGAPGGAFLLGSVSSYPSSCLPGWRPLANGDRVSDVFPWGEWQDSRGNVVCVSSPTV